MKRVCATLLALGVLAGCEMVTDRTASSPNESKVEGVSPMGLTVAGTAPEVTFSWTSVPGAAAYEVVVLDEAGHATWSWRGTSTTVAPPTHAAMPEHGSATVAAFTGDQEPIRLSNAVEY